MAVRQSLALIRSVELDVETFSTPAAFLAHRRPTDPRASCSTSGCDPRICRCSAPPSLWPAQCLRGRRAEGPPSIGQKSYSPLPKIRFTVTRNAD
jgi:hypothetical protein